MLAVLILCGIFPALGRGQAPSLDLAKMPRIGAVDERFLSYNIEMVEVTGGRFWKPYKSTAAAEPSASGQSGPAGMDPNLFEYRAPIDLSNPRLRTLAAALGPAYVRVSGTWANTVWFQDSDGAAPATPPAGFNSILTRTEWKAVLDFSRATHADLVTSFAFSAGTRDAAGVWTPAQASALLDFTHSAGGHIAAAEFMNEPTYAGMGGAPKGYDAAAYARDLAVFRPFLHKASPGTLLLGPGSVGEGGGWPIPPNSGMIKSEDLLQATGPAFDVFDYHLYAAVSQRCGTLGPPMQTTAAAALSADWLTRPDKIAAYYAGLRDRFEPGKPLWITETADAACGGNPWASTFLDSFRYLVQHGTLAQRGVQVILHNTLASSDYGLLDEKSYEPRPNYWASLLWRKLMGRIVLQPPNAGAPNVYLYAHCLRAHPGGVALLVINADPQKAFSAAMPFDSVRYTLSAHELQDTEVQLNGKTLALDGKGDLPALTGESAHRGGQAFAPASITFLEVSGAGNNACR